MLTGCRQCGRGWSTVVDKLSPPSRAGWAGQGRAGQGRTEYVRLSEDTEIRVVAELVVRGYYICLCVLSRYRIVGQMMIVVSTRHDDVNVGETGQAHNVLF